MTLKIQKSLLDRLVPRGNHQKVTEVRIGLGYTAVALDSGHAGVAWTPGRTASCCTHFQKAGTLAGLPASELLPFLVDPTSELARAVGLATANALLAAQPQPVASREDVISVLGITSQDHVVMVGYFGPIIAGLQATGCRLDIVELVPRQGETLDPEQGRNALNLCDVAILTGTAMVNGTCDELLADLGRTRAAVVLGPSTPLCPEAFTGTRITHLAGARIRDARAVLRIVSEGGGTMLLKKHMDFLTVRTALQPGGENDVRL